MLMLATASAADALTADQIPVAHTPPGPHGWGITFPRPVLAQCTEPLVKGAPDLRGIWKIVSIERYGKPLPKGDRMYSYAERIEQCGNRIVDTGGGQIADARADGTVANAVHEVSAFDFKTRIVAVASYEDGVFVLRPLPVTWIPLTLPWLEVTRRLDAQGRSHTRCPCASSLRVTPGHERHTGTGPTRLLCLRPRRIAARRIRDVRHRRRLAQIRRRNLHHCGGPLSCTGLAPRLFAAPVKFPVRREPGRR